MTEWPHDCGALIQQGELAEGYGDARPTTPAMRWAAIQANTQSITRAAATID